MTKACCEACANLKGAFLIAMVSLNLQSLKFLLLLIPSRNMIELNKLNFYLFSDFAFDFCDCNGDLRQ
jgi:hypothetical protein